MSDIQFSLSNEDIDRIAIAVASRITDRPAPASNGVSPLFYSEANAATMLGISVYLLKRLRQAPEVKEVTATRPKRPIGYTAGDVSAVAEYLKTGSSEELVGKLSAYRWKSFGLEPLGNRNNKAWGWLSVIALDRLRRPFIRRGHALRPGVSPDG